MVLLVVDVQKGIVDERLYAFGFKHRFYRSFPAPRVCPRDAGKYSLSPAFGSHRLHL